MDEKEAKKLMKSILENASEEYLNPGPELYGKYMVCKNYHILAIFDAEAKAMAYAEKDGSGSVEIRRVVPTDDGVSTTVTIPGAIGKLTK